MNKKPASVAIIAIIAIFSLISPGQTFAAANVTSSATTAISSDSATGSSVSLPAIVLTEGTAGDIPAGTFTWALPAGFAFDTTSIANVAYTGTGLSGSSTVAFLDSTHFKVTTNSTSSVAGTLTIGSTTPLKVKASAGTPLAAAGTILLSSGSLPGVATSTSFGLLTQVPGAAVKLVFSTPPSATGTVGITLPGVTVSVKDQFDNIVTSDSGRVVVLSAVSADNTSVAASSTLSGTTSGTTASGLATFNNFSYPQTGTFKLKASSSSLSLAFSNTITISNTTTTTPATTTLPSFIHNGLLVKVTGQPTVYMVINGTLRPFNTPAIFHARGKKFSDIIEISPAQFALFSIGKPVGESNDDRDDNGTPATSTTTAPSLTNLPEGTIVKVPGNPTIYIVSGGILKPFASMAVLNSHKKDLKKIKEISAADLSALTVGSPATFADGTLLQGSDATIYVVRNGQLFGIPSLAALKKHNLSLKNLNKVNKKDLDDVPHGGIED